MATAREVVQAFEELPEGQKKEAATEIQRVAPLPPPPAPVVGTLWLMVVGALVFGFVAGLIAVVILVLSDESTEVVAPIVTTVLGFLGGLLAPTPTTK
jgi:uncharacterized protein involved in exopolysaccharide biosynthesis